MAMAMIKKWGIAVHEDAKRARCDRATRDRRVSLLSDNAQKLSPLYMVHGFLESSSGCWVSGFAQITPAHICVFDVQLQHTAMYAL